MNKYEEALNYISTFLSRIRCRGIGKSNHFIKLYISLITLQELIDNYSKLEKSLDYLLNYLDKKYLVDDEKGFSRYLYKELLEEDIRRMLESEKQWKMKLKDYKPKYHKLELMVNRWGEYLTPIQMLTMTLQIKPIPYKEACKKYGDYEIASIKNFEDTHTTSIILKDWSEA